MLLRVPKAGSLPSRLRSVAALHHGGLRAASSASGVTLVQHSGVVGQTWRGAGSWRRRKGCSGLESGVLLPSQSARGLTSGAVSDVLNAVRYACVAAATLVTD